jgi:hypothetical protein
MRKDTKEFQEVQEIQMREKELTTEVQLKNPGASEESEGAVDPTVDSQPTFSLVKEIKSPWCRYVYADVSTL